jgi:hypothetical protein
VIPPETRIQQQLAHDCSDCAMIDRDGSPRWRRSP